MNINRRILTSIPLLIALACSREHAGKKGVPPTSPPPQPLPVVTLRQEWFPNSNYAGALAAMHDFAKDHNIVLKVLPGSDNVDPIKTVITGSDMFGDAGADKVLAANAKGADLVVVGVLNRTSPTCFVAKTETNIRVPKDFEGKTVGILTGTATEYVYRTLVQRAGVDVKSVREIEVPFDLGTFLTTNTYQVRPAFIYDEPVTLDQKGIKYRIIDPRSYGVEFLGTVYFTRREFLEKHPDLVKAFVFSVADGWTLAEKYPERAIGYLKAYDPQIDEKRELAALKKSLEYFKGDDNKILYASLSRWQEMAKSLRDLGAIGDVDLLKTIDYSFVEEYSRAADK